MSNVLVIVETASGKLRNHCLPGLSAGQKLAEAHGSKLDILVLGADATQAGQSIAAEGYGVAQVHTLESPALEPFTAEAWAEAIVHAVQQLKPVAVGGTASSTLRDALPRAAAKLKAPLVAEITDVKNKDTFLRPISAGRAIAEEQLSASLICFTVRGSEFPPAQSGSPAAQCSALPAIELSNKGVTVVRIEKTESSRPGLTEADVVVSGGRGMRESANFQILEQLTDLLGGALGASRAATDAGMVPADLQVGQTGKIVAPNLYFAVAISGAIQHLAGMKSSKTIVAINKDAEAPIFQIADYGLVAKWEDTIPRLIELIKAHKSG